MSDRDRLLQMLAMAIWYWECNLPREAGPTEREDMEAAKRLVVAFGGKLAPPFAKT